ncbi:SDR family oxidoreductase [Ramlibacter sp. G-1-2-2]|uniref:SDR family oxidoreductase n=1 Tax=Ramlibacter agri TaxID=2728837 RepID=A0A848GZQ8_9BURK|nr:SDR family oxidoreductase [Ramlibacter agri]NML42832.1 SDR family oxidoreductase [Ramlibacter agri]
MTRKIALVVGGSRGIGAASVQALAAAGFDVAYTYVNREAPEPHEQAGARVRGYRLDVGDAEAVQRVFADVAHDFGAAPHCVVASAGINVPPGPLASFPAARFRELVEVNIVGAFNVLAEAARQVQDGGTIIGLTTSMIRHAVPGGGPYTASKAAVESLLRSLAKELAGRKVRVNAVAPGPVDTDLFRSGKNEEALQRSAAMSPLNRVGRPEEIGEVVAFLASDKSSWITGQTVQPNGGLV